MSCLLSELRRFEHEDDPEPLTGTPVPTNGIIPPVRVDTFNQPPPLQPHLQVAVDDGIKLIVTMLARPHINYSPFYVAKTRNERQMIRHDAMNPFNVTFPVWVLQDPSTGIRMPFRFPSFSPRMNGTTKKYFGESVNRLRYKVVSIIIAEFESSQDAFLVEFAIQAKMGLGYGVLNQRVPAGSPTVADDDFDNHCVVVHFYAGLGELISEAKAIPNPHSMLPNLVGRLAPDDVDTYIAAFRDYWKKQFATLVETGSAPLDPVEYTREKMCYCPRSDETCRRISQYNLKKAASRWGVSLDYYLMFIQPLVQSRQYYKWEKGEDHANVRDIDEVLHWHTKKDVKQVISNGSTHVTTDGLTPAGHFLMSQVRYELRHEKESLRKCSSDQAIARSRFHIRFLKFQMKQIQEEYAVDDEMAEEEAVAADSRGDTARTMDTKIIRQYGGREMVMDRRRAVVLYGESCEQVQVINNRILNNFGIQYPENTSRTIKLRDVDWKGMLSDTGAKVIHTALVKQRKISARLGRSLLLAKRRKVEAEMEAIKNEVQGILKKYAVVPIKFWLQA